MKVLALITDGFGTGGGIGQYNRDLLSALSQSSAVTQVLVLPRHGCRDEHSGLDKVQQLAASSGRLGWSARALALGVRWRPDIIFCGHINAAPLAAVLARLLSRPLWMQVHGFEAWTPRGPMVRHAVEQASLVTAVSRFSRARLMGWSRVAPERVRVLPNTVAPSYAPRSRRADLVARYGLDGRKVLLTVGRIAAAERYKGHDRVIGSLPQILQDCPQALYLIVGGGDDRARLEALAEQSGVRDRVVFTGAVSAAELPDYFALADAFAMPSTGEGFGIVFLEAAMMGLPVVGGNVDGSLDALADGRIGCAVDPHDKALLAAAIVEALEGRQVRDASAANRFAFGNFARHVDDLVRGLGAGLEDAGQSQAQVLAAS